MDKPTINYFEMCTWENTVEVARARLLGLHPFLRAAEMCESEIRSVLSTRVVWC